MIMICNLINELTMPSEDKGKYKFIDVLDNNNIMNTVFEKFVYKFLKKEQKRYEVKYQKKLNGKLIKGIKVFSQK